MKDEFRATYSVDLAPADVWAAMRRDAEDPARPAAEAPLSVWLPGFESTAEVLESVPGSLLRVRKSEEPCKGTEIVVTLEAEGSGARITIVQSGFGAAFDRAANWLGVGADFIFRDFVLFIERGIHARRHFTAWGPSVGANFAETRGGLSVWSVDADTAAARAGLQPGDLLLALEGAAVITIRDLVMVTRTFRPGEDLAFVWLRGSAQMAGYGRL